MTQSHHPWPFLGADLFALGWEAGQVVALRSLKLMGGGAAAATEARLMVAEKIASVFELQHQALTGALGTTARQATSRTVSHLRGKVSANRRRLQR